MKDSGVRIQVARLEERHISLADKTGENHRLLIKIIGKYEEALAALEKRVRMLETVKK